MSEISDLSLGDQKTYWQQQLDQFVKQIDGTFDSSGHRTPLKPADASAVREKIGYAQAQVDALAKQIQEQSAASLDQSKAANTATNEAATRVEQNRHNLATEDQASKQFGLSYQLAQIQAEGLAIRAKAEQDKAAAKGDANKIATIRLEYEQARDANTAKLQAIKDQVTSLTSIDNTGTTEAVNQANSRNAAALTSATNATNTIGGMKGITDPGLAARAAGGLMQAGQQNSAASGGSPVPVGQLTDQHKAEILQLVLAGTPFNQAVQQTAAGAGQAPPPGTPAAGPTQPGFATFNQPSPGFSVNPSSPSAEQAAGTYTGGQ